MRNRFILNIMHEVADHTRMYLTGHNAANSAAKKDSVGQFACSLEYTHGLGKPLHHEPLPLQTKRLCETPDDVVDTGNHAAFHTPAPRPCLWYEASTLSISPCVSLVSYRPYRDKPKDGEGCRDDSGSRGICAACRLGGGLCGVSQQHAIGARLSLASGKLSY